MNSILDLMPRMSGNPWFGALPLRDRKAMLSEAKPLRLRPGEMLFRQGDAVARDKGAFYGVVEGHLKTSSLRDDGREAILAVLDTGNWFGEISLIDGLPRTHDVTAMGAAQVVALPGTAFEALMGRATFSRAIARLLAARTRLLYGMVEDSTLRSTRARVARRLLLLSRGGAAQLHDAQLQVRVTHEALAMMVGVSRQTLSKELKALVQAGAIRLSYGQMEICSIETLDSVSRG